MSIFWTKCTVTGCPCVSFDAIDGDERQCDCTHKRFCHQTDRIASVSSPGSPGFSPAASPSPSPRCAGSDITQQVSKVFENEVNRHLDDNFQNALPECTILGFKNRPVDDVPTPLEMDSFAYMTKDTLSKGEDVKEAGIYVVFPRNMAYVAALAAPIEKLGQSPNAKASNLESTAEKYVIGEAYCGIKERKMVSKVQEIELKIKKMVRRSQSLTQRRVNDVTKLVGAAILCFICPMGSKRGDFSKICKAKVLAGLSQIDTPYLWRLAAARRLFVTVLSSSEGAHTTSLREISSGLNSLQMGQLAQDQTLQQIFEIVNQNSSGGTVANQDYDAQHDYGT